jgi:hypothetical protein
VRIHTAQSGEVNFLLSRVDGLPDKKYKVKPLLAQSSEDYLMFHRTDKVNTVKKISILGPFTDQDGIGTSQVCVS